MTSTGYLLMFLAITVEYPVFPAIIGVMLVIIGLGLMRRH